MVCLNHNIPLIRMGDFDIGGYDEAWIYSEIRSAAARVGDVEAGFSSDVAGTVIGFLRDHCLQNVVGLDLVASQVRCCLRAIGRSDVARSLKLMAPPVYLHLGELTSRSENDFELGFYRIFGARLEALLRPGVRHLTLGGVEVALDMLRGPQEGLGRRKAEKEIVVRDALRDEIIAFAREALRLYGHHDGGITLVVEG